jgi:hypothetical protein
MELLALAHCYPVLYHMAEANTWGNISQYGLLSTSAILDLHSVEGARRLPYESMNRPDMMEVAATDVPSMFLRDQKPMTDARLEQGLNGAATPREWYELLNGKVFFWATQERLQTLLNARHYRTVEHDVLEVNSTTLIESYRDHIRLCHMNSGNTFPIPHPRDQSIFKTIRDYPSKPDGRPVKPVAELTVEYSVPDIRRHVTAVHRMRGAENLGRIY